MEIPNNDHAARSKECFSNVDLNMPDQPAVGAADEAINQFRSELEAFNKAEVSALQILTSQMPTEILVMVMRFRSARERYGLNWRDFLMEILKIDFIVLECSSLLALRWTKRWQSICHGWRPFSMTSMQNLEKVVCKSYQKHCQRVVEWQRTWIWQWKS